MTLGNSKCIGLKFMFLLVMFLMTLPACKRYTPTDLTNSNAATTSFAVPHQKGWTTSHVAYYLESKNNIAGTEKDCIRCHDSKAQAAPLNVSCATQCHNSSNKTIVRPQQGIMELLTAQTFVTPNSPSLDPAAPTEPVIPANPIKPNREVIATTCTQCHSSLLPPEMKFMHFPAAEGMCTFCHEASEKHEAGQENHGVTTKSAEDSCFQCHDKNDDKPHVHPALFMGDPSCVNCHDPHGSDHQYYIRQNSVPELCTTCHEPHQGKSLHGAEKINNSCVNCHNPHSSKEEKLLDQAPDDLCLSCHNKEISTQFATPPRVIPNVAKKMQEMPHQHTGALMGCLGCHSPHASANDRLLNFNFSLTNYNIYNSDITKGDPYELCFSCHDRSMLENKNYDTGFRNERKVGEKIVKKNLHWFHVVDASGYADKSRGRSCKICHDPHGSPQEFQINDSWQMNKVMIPIVYKQNDDGGSCAKTCHETRTYQRTQ